MALTDLHVRKAKPAESDYKMADGQGLTLLVRANGSKLWRFRYRFAGKEKMLSLGAYPEVSISDARESRDAARAQIRAGRDPSIERKRATVAARSAAGHTFESVARDWFELQKGRWAPVHANDVITSLERDIFPDLGGLPLSAIDAPLILDVLRKVERRGAIETAGRLRQRVSAVFVYAISLGIARDDPAALLSRALKPKKKAGKRPALVKVEDLRTLLDTVDRSGAYPLTLLASRLLALTAVRPGNVRHARWQDLYFSRGEKYKAEWRIPAEQMKLVLDRKEDEAFDHVVPLTPAAVEVLEAARRLSGNCELVFPGQRHAHIPLSENAIGYAYNRCGYKGVHVPHGWRAAFSTIMNEWAREHGRADDRQVIDLMLAHTPKDKVEAAYNRAEFMERRRHLAQVWSDMLMQGALPAASLLELRRRGRG